MVPDVDKTVATWNRCGYHVIFELNRHDAWLKTMSITIGEVRVAQAALKVKAGVWALIGGCVPVCTALLLFLVYTLMGGRVRVDTVRSTPPAAKQSTVVHTTKAKAQEQTREQSKAR